MPWSGQVLLSIHVWVFVYFWILRRHLTPCLTDTSYKNYLVLDFVGNLLKWISNFFQGRLQRVVTNGASSDWIGVNSGVPQGSGL